MLRLEDVEVHRGRTRVLQGISLEVAEGELVALIGANGAGKTTTLRTISGLLVPSAGRILVRRREIQGAGSEAIVRQGLAHCPEERKVWPRMSVLEHLELGAFARRDRREIADDMERVLALFPVLAERRGQVAGTLSGGEQQMLAIGRALMSRPSLLMFDEPSLGLAPLMVEIIGNLIRRIREQGTTVLLVEQNAALALRLADRAYVFEAGRVLLSGPARELAESPRVRQAYLGG